MANDIFAQIAANGIGGRKEFLTDPEPMKIDVKECVLGDSDLTPFKISEKISTKEELYSELDKMREYYKPFLRDLAPEIPMYYSRKYLTEFVLDGKEKIKIPEYGGPVGYAKKVYETEFYLDQINADKAYFIRFLGADYKAFVYINGKCLGSHEGFFSPFEFDFTECALEGSNKLKIELYNDYNFMGRSISETEKCEGEKLYAATGPGWDDPILGWHHCPPGMGLYNSIYIEERNKIHIDNIFVRPLPQEEKAEVWVDVNSTERKPYNISLELSLYGQNFDECIFENLVYNPQTILQVGMGDSLTAAQWFDRLGKGVPQVLYHGRNVFKVMVDIKNPRLWELDTPYLYQMQVELKSEGKTYDIKKSQFGMRSFKQDLEASPKGMFYLNGKKIRLRGANTMGFEQQDVLRGDIDRLLDDMLLAKLCNMNFLRLTQRPVQDEIYDICDKIGLMTQTDLPLFGPMRIPLFCEGIRQAEEMERLVRNHPCNIMVTYVNEPFPNANNEPHRHLTRDQFENFFTACDYAVWLNNPDRVIKHVDGDYDPPTTSMPDNHCYPMWYNGHGIDIGRLHRGYWLSVKPDWYYGCGEYGIEGLDFAEVMREEYPKHWLTEPFDPSNILNAQTGNFYHFYYDKQDTLDDWVKESQRYQGFAVGMMTEAFRRNPYMISNAVHLFIDAWPAGWMKTIMDCRRNPKQAYFTYRNALEPVMMSLRTDRFTYYAGEKISIEAYICNDTSLKSDELTVRFEAYMGEKLILANNTSAKTDACDVNYAANAVFSVDSVEDREKLELRAILIKDGKEIAHNSLDLEVFAAKEIIKNDNVEIISMLTPGEYEIAGEKVTVKECGMMPLHFVSRKTGHKAVEDFKPRDFAYWYNKAEDMITPIIDCTFETEGFEPILLSGNQDNEGNWHEVLACGVKEMSGKKYVICQVDLRQENPIAQRFLKALNEL